MDPYCSLPLWIPASAGMTKGAGMTFTANFIDSATAPAKRELNRDYM